MSFFRRYLSQPVLKIAFAFYLIGAAMPNRAVTWDLGTDWPNVNNGGAFSTTGWWLAGGNYPPLQVVGGQEVGDLVAYSPAEATWTSTSAGSVNISGDVWYCPFTDGQIDWRDVDWKLYKNGVLLTSGMVGDGIGYYRSNPFLFSNGSGGADVLESVAVAPGDTLTLKLDTDPISYQAWGGFVGVNFTVSTSSVPESGSSLMMLGSVTLVAMMCRFRRTKTI